MAEKIKIAGPYLLILVLVGILIGFNYWTSRVKADTGSTTTTLTVSNIAPTVSGVSLGTVPSGDNGYILLTESKDTQIVVSASVNDTTCAELSGVKAYVFVSSSSWEYIGDGTTCSFDWNDCYTPEQISSCDQTSCTGGAAVYTCEADHGNGMWYHASPTDSTASYSTEFWYAMMIASDSSGADGWATTSVAVDVRLLQAFAPSSSLAYSATAPGSDSSIISTVTVENTGNRGINFTINAANEAGAGLEISGGGYNIATQAQQFSTVSFTVSDGNAVSLSETAFEVDEGGLPKPQTHTAGDNDDQLFWGIAVPADATAGDYTGTTTYTSTYD